MTVSWYGVSGARSNAQSKKGLITTLVMVWPSESTIGGVPVFAVSPSGSTAFKS
jgi:hypothetical protein